MRAVFDRGDRGNESKMVRAMRTAALAAVVAVVVVAIGVPTLGVDEGADDARPPSSEPPGRSPSGADLRVGVGERANRGAGRVTASTTTTRATGPGWQHGRGEAALALLGYPWQAVGYRIEFLPAQAGLLGETFPERRLIRIYVREQLSIEELARNVAHELGHAIDFTRNADADRQLYRDVRGIAGSAWLACRGCPDLATPAGDFAETFSYWVLEGRFPSRSRIGAPIDGSQMARVERLFSGA